MASNKATEVKIIMSGSRIITRRELFKQKERFHRKQARLPFEEKIKIVVNLQKIANSIRKPGTKEQSVWKISFK